jgi:thioredoxin reductase (NADPH)
MKHLLFLLTLIPTLMFAQKEYDVIVIGGGPSGLSAAILCQEFGFRTCIVDEKEFPPKPSAPPKPPETPPPTTENTEQSDKEKIPPPPPVTAHPGSESPQWISIKKILKESYLKAGGEFIQKKVTSFSQSQGIFNVSTEKDTFHTQSIVIATGRHPQKLLSVKESFGRILHRLWNEKALSPKDTLFLIGQDEPLFKQAVMAASVSNNVFLFPNKNNQMDLKPLLKSFPSITIVDNATIGNISASREGALLQYVKNKIKTYQKASYIILADSWEPSSELAENLALDSSKNIIASNNTFETSLKGVFACGEVIQSRLLTWIQAAAEGQEAGWAAVHYLIDNGIAPRGPKTLPPH